MPVRDGINERRALAAPQELLHRVHVHARPEVGGHRQNARLKGEEELSKHMVRPILNEDRPALLEQEPHEQAHSLLRPGRKKDLRRAAGYLPLPPHELRHLLFQRLEGRRVLERERI